MVSFELDGTVEETSSFVSSLQYFALGESLGGVRALVCLPCKMTHASIPAEERHALGLSDTLVRLSPGCESPRDLVRDIVSGLDRLGAGTSASRPVSNARMRRGCGVLIGVLAVAACGGKKVNSAAEAARIAAETRAFAELRVTRRLLRLPARSEGRLREAGRHRRAGPASSCGSSKSRCCWRCASGSSRWIQQPSLARVRAARDRAAAGHRRRPLRRDRGSHADGHQRHPGEPRRGVPARASGVRGERRGSARLALHRHGGAACLCASICLSRSTAAYGRRFNRVAGQPPPAPLADPHARRHLADGVVHRRVRAQE